MISIIGISSADGAEVYDIQKTVSVVNDSTVSTDSVNVHELDSLVVKGRTRMFTGKGSSYIPTMAQKKSSMSAIDLLARMSIPQIKAMPGDETATDLFGNTISVFINYQPASREDILGMRTIDVKKVEYMEYPSDPRFRGEPKVVNFIIHSYAFGGYTKATVSESFLAGLSSNANIFSKFVYKRMTYDVFAQACNWHFKHSGSENISVFRGIDMDGVKQDITRTERIVSSDQIQANYPVTFRASYNSDKVQIRNQVGYTHWNLGKSWTQGELEFFPSISKGYEYEHDNPELENTLQYEGNFFFILPKKFTLSVYPTFQYSHIHRTTSYESSVPLDIRRDAKDRMLLGALSLIAQKRIGDKHTLTFRVMSNAQSNKTTYSGTDNFENNSSREYVQTDLGYQYSWQRFSVSPMVGFIYTGNAINDDKKIHQFQPSAQVYTSYVPNNSNSFNLYVQYTVNRVAPSALSSEIIRENEVLFYTGNSGLRSSPKLVGNIGYGFMPGNIFEMYLYGSYTGIYDKTTTLFENYDNGRILVRRYVNDGNFSQFNVGTSANLSLLNRSLQISCQPEGRFFHTTGIYERRVNCLALSANISYYIRNFYFTAHYRTASHILDPGLNQIVRDRDHYFIMAGWGNGNWNIRMTAYDFFRTGWTYSTAEIDTPLYHNNMTRYGQSGHSSISLSVSYSFGYGKRIERGDEVGAVNRGTNGLMSY